MTKAPKRPRDPNQLAKLITDMATGQASEAPTKKESDMATLGRQGGLKGGIARKEALSPEARAEIARKAAATRWSKKR